MGVVPADVTPAPPAPPPALRRALLAGAALLYITGTFGSNVGPAWIDERPALVLALSSRNRNLFASVPYIDPVPYALIGFARLFVVAMVLYYVGAWFGSRALAWTEAKVGELPAIYRWFQTGIDRAGWAFVVLMQGSNLVCMMAGHRRMPMIRFAPLLAVGIVLKLVVLRALGNAFEDQIRSALDFIDKYQWWLVGGLFLLSFLQSGRKAKRAATPSRNVAPAPAPESDVSGG